MEVQALTCLRSLTWILEQGCDRRMDRQDNPPPTLCGDRGLTRMKGHARSYWVSPDNQQFVYVSGVGMQLVIYKAWHSDFVPNNGIAVHTRLDILSSYLLRRGAPAPWAPSYSPAYRLIKLGSAKLTCFWDNRISFRISLRKARINSFVVWTSTKGLYCAPKTLSCGESTRPRSKKNKLLDF